MISILLHLILVLFFASGKISTNNKDTQNLRINSYITFKSPPTPKPQTTTINDSNVTSEDLPQKQEIVDEVSASPVDNEKIKKSAVLTGPKEPAQKPVPPSDEVVESIQSRTSQYIQEANNIALDKLSSHSLNDFLKPKPINNKPSSSISQQIQKTLDESFAPLGSNITVVSQTGDETLILHGDSCYKVEETALDDKVWRGSALWTRSSECGSTDKFNGQLQISLDKYLKK